MKSLLFFPVLLSLSRYFSTFLHFANAALVNRTIDDSDVLFSYSPLANWQSSNNASCLTCLQPNLQNAFQKTLHYGIHASGPDADDIGKASSLLPSASEASVPPPPPSGLSSAPSSPPSSASPLSPSSSSLSSPSSPPPSILSSLPSPAPSPGSQVAAVITTKPAIVTPSSASSPPLASATSEDGGGKKKGGGGSVRRELNMLRRTDADDPNFVDVNMTATLNFTGSAFYVFCALPVQINNTSILALTNLTFFLDSRLVGNYTHDPRTDKDSSTGFQYQVMVFSKSDLPYAPHVLVIKPELGSMVLLDYVQYTTLETGSGADSGTLAPQATPSGVVNSASSGSSNKNKATFAVAIGCTVGVLAVLSFTVFISICLRRRKSAKREKEREAFEAATRPASPEMRGPQPFIPRYFPGNSPPRGSSPPFSPLSTSSGGEESGPSHGLDFPPVPEHLDAPAYSPPPLVLSEVVRTPASLLTPVRCTPPPMEEVRLPQYHDLGRTALVSNPMYAHTSVPPPGFAEPSSFSSSPSRTEGGDTSSSPPLLPGRSDINQGESPVGHINISPINNPNDQPG